MSSAEPQVPMPNFFVIGANRSGTTSLHEYLSQHPDVFMSAVKEPSYFAPKARQEHPLWPNRATPTSNLDEYLALFSGVDRETAIGEASTAYLSSREAPQLIRSEVPEAKLIAILRNPADRAFSGYCLHRSWGTEDLSFADAVSAELDQQRTLQRRNRGYVLLGFYGKYLTHFLEYFARERLRVYLYDDLVSNPNALMRDVFEYLVVDPSFVVSTAVRHNAARYDVRHKAVDRVTRLVPLKATARRLVSERSWERAKQWMRRTNSVPPEFPDDVRRHLIELYRSDIELTQQIIGRDLSAWLA